MIITYFGESFKVNCEVLRGISVSTKHSSSSSVLPIVNINFWSKAFLNSRKTFRPSMLYTGKIRRDHCLVIWLPGTWMVWSLHSIWKIVQYLNSTARFISGKFKRPKFFDHLSNRLISNERITKLTTGWTLVFHFVNAFATKRMTTLI